MGKECKTKKKSSSDQGNWTLNYSAILGGLYGTILFYDICCYSVGALEISLLIFHQLWLQSIKYQFTVWTVHASNYEDQEKYI